MQTDLQTDAEQRPGREQGIGLRDSPAPVMGLWLFLILLAVLFAYGPVLDGPLFFDDEPNLLDNTLVQLEGVRFEQWRLALVSNDSGLLHRPVAMLTFALNYLISDGFTGFSLKTVNLLVHIANGGLLYWLFTMLLRTPVLSAGLSCAADQRRLLALGAAAIWLLHPLHASTVLYAVQRMAMLSTLFTLSGLVLYLHYRLRWAVRGAGPGELIAAALWLLILGLLAVLSKENGALLCGFILVCEVTLLQGQWQGRQCRALLIGAWLALVLPFLLVALVTLFSPSSLPGNYSGREFDLPQRLMTQARALWTYLYWLAVPDITQMGFFHDDIPVSRGLTSPLTTATSIVAWCLVLLVGLVAYRKFPLVSFAFLFYLVGHSMESTVLPLELYFEHRNYLPSVGMALLLMVVLHRACKRAEFLRFAPCLVGILLCLSVLLAVRASAWGDSHSLAQRTVLNHPDSPRANFYYALSLVDKLHAARAVGVDPQQEANLAIAARAHYRRVHELDPRSVAAVVMLYQFDSTYFPSAAVEHDWLDVLETLVSQRKLHTSDLAALNSLIHFAESTQDEGIVVQVHEILATLVERYPWRAELLDDFYLIHQARGGARDEVLPLLERALAMNERSTLAASHLVAYHAGEDIPETYRAIMEWYRRDTLRRELPAIRALLDP